MREIKLENMILTDDHCHLTHNAYKEIIDEVILKAKQAGVKAINCSGVNPETNRESLMLAEKYSDIVKFSAGIYPVDALGVRQDGEGLTAHKGPIDIDSEFEFIKQNKNKIVSIGEVGLDYQWIQDSDLQKKQRENFQKIIEHTEKIKKPILVHTRKAEQDVIDMLMSSKIKTIILHCFEGRKNLIQKTADAGYMFSIPTNIQKNQHFQMIVDMISINQILTETDGPLNDNYGNLIYPWNVSKAIQIIATVNKIPVDEIELQITSNFKKLISIKSDHFN